MKFCICAEFLDRKLSEKSNFETPEGVATKARVPSLNRTRVGGGAVTLLCEKVSTEKPRYNEGPAKGLAKYVRYNEVR